jgi:serine O-acetyltransferase
MNFAYYLYKSEHSLYLKRIPLIPYLIQGILRVCFCAVIPPQAKIGKNVLLGYNGLGIVIHPRSIIGNNVIIGSQVTIGGRGGPGVPIIGNNVLLGTGAKILGGIKIGDNAKIGANAVVLIDVPENATAVGVPAIILQKDKNVKLPEVKYKLV